MAMEAQRLHNKADDIRRSREERRKQYDERHGTGDEPGPADPDDDPELREGPATDNASAIARSEALSAMRPVGEMAGYGVDPGVYDRAETEITELGREMSDMVETRLQEWRDSLGAELDAVGGGNVPKGFIYGSLYGAAVCLGSLAGALILTRLGRRE